MFSLLKQAKEIKTNFPVLLGFFLFLFLLILVPTLYLVFQVKHVVDVVHIDHPDWVAHVDLSHEKYKTLQSYDGVLLSQEQLLKHLNIPSALLDAQKTPYKENIYIIRKDALLLLAGRVDRQEAQVFMQVAYPGWSVGYEGGILIFTNQSHYTSVMSDSSPSLRASVGELSLSANQLIRVVVPHTQDTFIPRISLQEQSSVEEYLLATLTPPVGKCDLVVEHQQEVPHIEASCDLPEKFAYLLRTLPSLEQGAFIRETKEGLGAYSIYFPFSSTVLKTYGELLDNERHVPVSSLLSSLVAGAIQRLVPLSTIGEEMKTLPAGTVGLAWNKDLRLDGGVISTSHVSDFAILSHEVRRIADLYYSSLYMKETSMPLPDGTKGIVLSMEDKKLGEEKKDNFIRYSASDFPVRVSLDNSYKRAIIDTSDEQRSFAMERGGLQPLQAHALFHIPASWFLGKIPVQGTFWQQEEGNVRNKLDIEVQFTSQGIVIRCRPMKVTL